MTKIENRRNIAIIAHVDHGKTTLVNELIKEAINVENRRILIERALDSNELERERGITILAKTTSIKYKDIFINIVDTPGHADFGGEVERIISMVDGVILVVDAFEGPLAQTRFVLEKALSNSLKIVVVINKVDRTSANISNVLDQLLDMFIDLGANEDQLSFPVVYTSALNGTSSFQMEIGSQSQGMVPVLETIINSIPAPVTQKGDLQFQVSLIDYDDYLGQIGIGRITRGSVHVGETVSLMKLDGSIECFRVAQLFNNYNLKRIKVESAHSGDIVAITGCNNLYVGETISSLKKPEALPIIKIHEPTMKMTFLINDSPFAGHEGSILTMRKIEERLKYEARKDVALKILDTNSPNMWIICGRGELHFSILIEKMRREGYEFQVTRPIVIEKEIDGTIYEPHDKVEIKIPTEFVGKTIESLTSRYGQLISHESHGDSVKIEFIIPTKGLIGYNTEFMSITKGYGEKTQQFFEYKPIKKSQNFGRKSGSLISKYSGTVTTYGLENTESCGTLFVNAGDDVYSGMIIGESNRSEDLIVNITRKRHLNNMHSATKEATYVLKRIKNMTLEESLSFVKDDEYCEVTPKVVRIRKKNITSI